MTIITIPLSALESAIDYLRDLRSVASYSDCYDPPKMYALNHLIITLQASTYAGQQAVDKEQL